MVGESVRVVSKGMKIKEKEEEWGRGGSRGEEKSEEVVVKRGREEEKR
jgi:hypothetical protein